MARRSGRTAGARDHRLLERAIAFADAAPPPAYAVVLQPQRARLRVSAQRARAAAMARLPGSGVAGRSGVDLDASANIRLPPDERHKPAKIRSYHWPKTLGQGHNRQGDGEARWPAQLRVANACVAGRTIWTSAADRKKPRHRIRRAVVRPPRSANHR